MIGLPPLPQPKENDDESWNQPQPFGDQAWPWAISQAGASQEQEIPDEEIPVSDFLNIGSSPSEEDCFPVGHPLAHQECEIYREQLEREFPKGDFRVKGFPHDFGRYYEVVAVFGVAVG